MAEGALSVGDVYVTVTTDHTGGGLATSSLVKQFTPQEMFAAAQKAKAEPPVDFSSPACAVVKASDERRYTLGVAYAANRADAAAGMDGYHDFVQPDVLEKAAWDYMRGSRNIGVNHEDGTDGRGEVVESYILRQDWVTKADNGVDVTIPAGSWMLGVVWEPTTWTLVKSGQLTGFSPQGTGDRAEPTPEDLAQLHKG